MTRERRRYTLTPLGTYLFQVVATIQDLGDRHCHRFQLLLDHVARWKELVGFRELGAEDDPPSDATDEESAASADEEPPEEKEDGGQDFH